MTRSNVYDWLKRQQRPVRLSEIAQGLGVDKWRASAAVIALRELGAAIHIGGKTHRSLWIAGPVTDVSSRRGQHPRSLANLEHRAASAPWRQQIVRSLPTTLSELCSKL